VNVATSTISKLPFNARSFRLGLPWYESMFEESRLFLEDFRPRFDAIYSPL
jgi:hypothetical protein